MSVVMYRLHTHLVKTYDSHDQYDIQYCDYIAAYVRGY